MATCPAYTEPIRARRRMMQLGHEESYGIPALELTAFPLQESLFPLQPSTTMVSRHEDYAYQATPIPMEAAYPIEGMTYLQYAENLVDPAWTKILELAGFPRDFDDEHGDRIVYAPGTGKSATVDVFYGTLLHRATGTRSAFTFRAEAGLPIRCEFSMRGLYTPVSIDTSIVRQDPFTIPPLFKNIDFFITPYSTGTAIQPILKNMTIDIGVQLMDRIDDNPEGSITEIMHQPIRNPTWGCQIEAHATMDWMAYFFDEEIFQLHLTMYDESSSRMIVYTPLGYTAKLNAVPTYGENNGVTVQELQFSLMEDRYLEVELL